jgi:hypothetical protein
MKTLEQATSRELEIAQVTLAMQGTKRAIGEHQAVIASHRESIARLEGQVWAMQKKQTARLAEIVRQKALLIGQNMDANFSKC